MATQAILWTVLPNGYTEDGESLRVSILASPRLDPVTNPRTLKRFPDFVDWPATVAASRFTFSLGGGGGVPIGGEELAGENRIDTSLGTADSATWKALFPATTFVRGFEFKDLSTNAVLSYDTSAIESLVQSLYTELARNVSDQLPTISDFVDDFGWTQVINAVEENDRRFSNRKTGLRDPKRQFELVGKRRPGAERGLAENLARFQLFHTPPMTPKRVEHRREADDRIKAAWLEYERKELPEKSDFAKQIDFHQIVAAMNQYPTLLRRLGLVVDFVIDATAFAASPNAPLAVAVELPRPTAGVTRLTEASPHTRAALSPTRFEACPRTTPEPGDYRTSNGLLDLDPGQFRLVQADVDGAGLKLMSFARSLARVRPAEERVDPTTRFEREIGAPSLRNAGLMLVHHDRAGMLENSFERNKKRDDAVKAIQGSGGGAPPELFAEDLVRGYRVDVWDGNTEVWRSLCRRVARYDIGDGEVGIAVPDEEGTVRLAATKSPDPASNQNIVFLHEVLTSWTGWSLCAPQPGKAIDTDDQKIRSAEAEVAPGMRLSTSFEVVEGSLPRLRYGRRYWIRARVVDLAGNSLDPQPDDFGPEAPSKNASPYLRYDPIAAPVIALRRDGGGVEKPAEGESMHRLAIRSFNVAPADNTVPTGQIARRFAVPPRTTVRESEQHGMLDAGGKVDAATFGLLKGQDKELGQVELETSGPLADPASAVKTTYAVFEDGAALPYLPDPLAAEISARIFDLPGWNDADVIRIPLYPAGEWPHAEPFTIEIFDDPAAAPEFGETDRTLRIPLPKGIRATLRLSVRPSREALELMGVWNWLSTADRRKLTRSARSGQHWMLTPWRTIELVHAVQKPLLEPDFEVKVARSFAETSARPTFVAQVSLKSTDRVDLQAEWDEPVDDPEKPGGENRARSDTAFAVKVTDEKSYAMRNLDPKHTGIPDHQIVGPDRIRAGGRLHDLVQPKAHEFHDTRYRRIEYWLEATTKFREYMPTNVLTEKVGGELVPTDKDIKVIGERVRTWIPSSAPPPAPEVLYALPTFGWVRTSKEGKQASWRRGSGLRIYLDRPWNVSGYGEMLAVVLLPAAFKGDPNGHVFKNSVTQWANDPIWASPFVNGIGPRRADFPLSRTEADPGGAWLPDFAPATEADQPPGAFRVTGLAHPAGSTSEGLVEIAPHDVFYDDERELGYCDVELAGNASYYPFIRLALARYQPVAVDYRTHLSNIVLADFMSLAPDRWLNVTETRDPRVRRVGVFGPTYDDSAGHVEAEHSPSMSLRLPDGWVSLVPAAVSPSSVVEVWVERLDVRLGEDFGWEREPAAVVRSDATLGTGRRVKKKTTIARERTRARKLLEGRNFEELARAGLIGRLRVTPTLWEGSVSLPAAPSPETRYRLVIAEYEEYLVDDLLPYSNVPTKKDRRLVFVEHVELA